MTLVGGLRRIIVTKIQKRHHGDERNGAVEPRLRKDFKKRRPRRVCYLRT